MKGDNKPLFAVSANDGLWVIKENKKIEPSDGFETDSHGNRELILKENENSFNDTLLYKTVGAQIIYDAK